MYIFAGERRFRKIFISISTQPEEAFRQGIPVRAWDLVFYVTFGLVVTSSVQIAGVLLVFSFLIVPAVAATLFAQRLSHRLIFGWSFGSIASLVGILCSYYFDLPTGATTVCSFGGLLLLLGLARKLKVWPRF